MSNSSPTAAGRRLPVIIGVSRRTDKKFSGTPSEFLADLLRQALKDASNGSPQVAAKVVESISDVMTVRMGVEDIFRPGTNCEPYKNLAQQATALAGAANPNQRYYATGTGGNTPQYLVNEFSERITKGQSEVAVILGAELLKAFKSQAMKAGGLPNWGSQYESDKVTKPVDAFLNKHSNDAWGASDVEKKNDFFRPIRMYPLLEQAYRAERGETIAENIARNARGFERFNEVAATKEKDLAWFPQRRTAEAIAEEGPNNRWVSFPYPKFMNAVMEVNQGACIIVASEEFALKAGIPEDRLVYLRGCADAVEPGYFVSVRPRLGTSYAMTECIDSALRHAQATPRDIAAFDLYSCFPIAVQVAADYLGVDPATEKRPLTVTGGLPYYGGPGNAYVCCSIAAMIERLRNSSKTDLGLVNANGWYMTKHAAGVYSRTAPPEGVFVREDAKKVQARADKRAGNLVTVVDCPEGEGIIETYTVDFNAKGKVPKVLVIGRLADGLEVGKRFLGSLAPGEDPSLWMKHDGIGLRVKVWTDEKKRTLIKSVSADSWNQQTPSGITLRPEVLEQLQSKL